MNQREYEVYVAAHCRRLPHLREMLDACRDNWLTDEELYVALAAESWRRLDGRPYADPRLQVRKLRLEAQRLGLMWDPDMKAEIEEENDLRQTVKELVDLGLVRSAGLNAEGVEMWEAVPAAEIVS